MAKAVITFCPEPNDRQQKLAKVSDAESCASLGGKC